MGFVTELRYFRLDDPADPDDYRPESRIALAVDPEVQLALLFEVIAPGDWIPLHTHPHEEAFVILEGSAEVRLGNELRVVEPGTVVFVPPETPHGTRNPGPGQVRLEAVFPSPRIGIRYLERNPAPGTEADPPQPPWTLDAREVAGV